MAAAPEETRPGRLRRLWIWLAVVLTWGLLLFSYHHLAMVAEGEAEPLRRPFINEMTAAVAGGLLFFGVRRLATGWPLTRATWLRRLPLYGLALVLFASLHTTMMWGLRSAIYPLAGLGRFDYGAMPLRYFMEMSVQSIVFAGMVGGVHAWEELGRAREREMRTARLEASLARAQLRSLRLQLQPHFLFNALNTISAAMYHDPRAADEMLDQLAELLRTSLRTTQADEVPLQAELETLQCYLGLMRQRFGEGLRVALEIESETRTALVPSMILQPLVENAIRHGQAEETGQGAVTVRARKDGGRLWLEVEDDGPGAPPGRDVRRAGLGLSATAERLHLLYGDDHRFEAGNGTPAGFRVRVGVPFRLAAEAPA
jgi:two-component system, LytTR family, sensor kinase